MTRLNREVLSLKTRDTGMDCPSRSMVLHTVIEGTEAQTRDYCMQQLQGLRHKHHEVRYDTVCNSLQCRQPNLECLPFLLFHIVCPHITQILLSTVTTIDDHPVSEGHCCMAISDWWSCPLHIWTVPGVSVDIKHSNIIQVWLSQSCCWSLRRVVACQPLYMHHSRLRSI